MGVGRRTNRDDVVIGIVIIVCFPFSPFIFFFGLAAEAGFRILAFCKVSTWDLRRFDDEYTRYITMGILIFFCGPIVFLILPFYASFLGIVTLVARSFKSRGKEAPLFIQRNEWRGSRERNQQSTEYSQHESRQNSVNLATEHEHIEGTYLYEQLYQQNDIRVLEIFPGQPDEPLKVSLCHANLTHHPIYDALSYTWADESGDSRRSIPVSVCPHNTLLFVTSNCAGGMRRLRLKDIPRRVWIDAVCIDQAQKAERNHQVALMARIYTQARQVVIYTGEATPSSDALFAWLEGLDGRSLNVSVIMRQLRLLTSSTGQSLNPVANTAVPLFRVASGGNMSSFLTNPSAVTSSVSISDDELQYLVRDFVSRRWFSRVWVVQEMALADVRNTVVVAGDKEVSAVRVMHALSLLDTKVKASETTDIFVLLARGAFREYSYSSGTGNAKMATSHLLDMLIATRAHTSEDPRDKIFGVLSVAQSWDGLMPGHHSAACDADRLPIADYTLSTREVFTRYSAFFIREHGLGYFLSLLKSPSEIDGLPSWAADWTVPWPNMKAVTNASTNRRPARARKRFRDDTSDALVIPGWGNENNEMVLVLRKPRIFSGFFSREGHLDGAPDVLDVSHMESVSELGNDLVLVEIYPGLAVLLKEDMDFETDYRIVCACPHARTQEALGDVVAQWSSVVVDGIDSDEISLTELEQSYLSEPQSFRIR